jgi:mannose-6-phosphate isomerase-like protein (cupin superfamily)
MAYVNKVNLDAALAKFSEHWQPKRVATVNDYDVRLAKIEGEFPWHRHLETDELFLVLHGELTIRLRDREVRLGTGELFVVPAGVEHSPYAAAEASVLLLEPSETINTGDAGGERTAEVRPL